ncbi:hypothetical protein [Vaccinia virus]|uniref:Uncharacterized protein n=1 Tax=Vaccinia virus TaxID=10245 RepID=A0A2I6J1M4_VACCV|nr:hypothetical protein [Vaccinia virus]
MYTINEQNCENYNISHGVVCYLTTVTEVIIYFKFLKIIFSIIYITMSMTINYIIRSNFKIMFSQ